MWLWLLFIVFGLFSFVVFFGAPYLPVFSKQAKIALELLDLQPGQTLLELGCGDGRVLVAAAEQGYRVTGYELNPLLAALSWSRTRRYKGQVRVIWGNYWKQQWPDTDGIYVFLLDKYMKKLDKKIIQTYSGKTVKLVSFAFQVPNKKTVKSQDGLFLYRY